MHGKRPGEQSNPALQAYLSLEALLQRPLRLRLGWCSLSKARLRG